MKLALLNLPIDANYGGNLQRYALMTVLERLGHDVVHLNLKRKWNLQWYKAPFCILKRFFYKIMKKKVKVFAESFYQKEYEKQLALIEPFYEKYIKHTVSVYSEADILKISNQYDGFVVGSDQVWRKCIAKPLSLELYFLSFVCKGTPKVAYSVSLGVDCSELCSEEISCLKKLYEEFTAVSVRENSALSLLHSYDWSDPIPEQLIDPTLLLSKEEYISLFENAETKKTEGNIFCYILDKSESKMNEIKLFCENVCGKPFFVYPNSISIEQWLRNFHDCQYIVTDSFHGFVFSIIFNKPVKLLFNEFRGNARFDSLINLFQFDVNSIEQDWKFINEKIEIERQRAFDFLKRSLSEK